MSTESYVQKCSNWYHGDLCMNDDCKRGWRERGEDRHLGCEWCEGSMWVRVYLAERTPGGAEIWQSEPFNPMAEEYGR